MKKSAACLIAVALVLLGAFTAQAIHDTVPAETAVPEPGPDADKLYAYIVKQKPYTAWDLWPEKGRLYRAAAHGDLLTTFVNPTAYKSIKDKKGMAPGSIIAKESYTAEKMLTGLVVMYKIKGYNPEAGDWFWARYSPDGKVIASGKEQGCINCHASKKDNDFVYTGGVK